MRTGVPLLRVETTDDAAVADAGVVVRFLLLAPEARWCALRKHRKPFEGCFDRDYSGCAQASGVARKVERPKEEDGDKKYRRFRVLLQQPELCQLTGLRISVLCCKSPPSN